MDFGILGHDGALLGFPVHYRDSRNDGMMEKAFAIVPRDEIFRHTGLQFMQFNTIFQLLAMRLADSPQLRVGDRILLMADLFNYFFSGERALEFSLASTTQCYNPRKKKWAVELLEALEIPTHLFGPIIPSATTLGKLAPSVAEEAGFAHAGETPVIAALGHDTAAAVAAVPAKGEDWCYISSGTWSLMGAELPKPAINKKAGEHNFTNEGGLGGSIRFLHNIAGMWLMQQARGQWAREGTEFSYAQLTAMAAKAPPLASLIDPDHGDFLAHGDMATRIGEACRRTGEPAPHSRGAVARCILESLAMRYRLTLEQLEECLGRRFQVIHIVGGGSQNELLNQMTADATGLPVVAGPVEATAIGNVMAQALARGAINDHAELRSVVARSFPTKAFEPTHKAAWDARYPNFVRLTRGGR
ncbi:MAG: rhamnulokinase [Candidatus Sumerlaeota bacterium]|nr:rhamnulokinase [Candidatus Sumerlaeota bacterium]